MNGTEKLEIDRILSEIADEGTSLERIEQLDTLLRNRPQLQEYYSQAIALHTLLAYELDLSLQKLRPVMSNSDWHSNRTDAQSIDECVELSDRLRRDLSASDDSITPHRRSYWSLITIAGVILIGVSYLFFNWIAPDGVPSSGSPTLVAGGGQATIDASATSIANNTEGLVVRDTRSLVMLSRLTRTESLTSLHLPCGPNGSPRIALCSGTAWMERSAGRRERGYLVELPSGCKMDLYVDTDADGQNALAIVEIDERGRMTGGTLSFNNSVEGDEATSKRRTGSIGNYSVSNDGRATKFYLFTGSHILPQQSVDESWYQSDYKVQHMSRDFLVIGWDDSGYTAVEEPTIGDYTPDRDYNDISALLRFSYPNGDALRTVTGLNYSPQPLLDAPIANETDTGYRLNVKPGEQLVMLISSSASLRNVVQIAEVPSRRIVWQHDGVSVGNSEFQAETAEEPLRSIVVQQSGLFSLGQSPHDSEVGVYIIRNHSRIVRQYELCARFKTRDDHEWSDTPHKVLDNGNGSVTIGFEDSMNQPALVDWNDIRVHARWFSD